MPESQVRHIRSYITRTQRLTARQARGLHQGWPVYGIGPLSLHAPGAVQGAMPSVWGGGESPILQCVPDPVPCIFEIGFGMGEALLNMALSRPDQYYLGADVYLPGIGGVLANLLDNQVNNVRLFRGDAVEILTHCVPDHFLSGVHLFFPDPWPKRRHHKRRIVTVPFLTLLARKVKQNGYWHVATDWAPYAEAIQNTVARVPYWCQETRVEIGQDSVARWRPETKYELRGKRRAHRIWEQRYINRPLATALD